MENRFEYKRKYDFYFFHEKPGLIDFRRKISDKEILNLVLEKHRNETLVNKKENKKIDEKPWHCLLNRACDL